MTRHYKDLGSAFDSLRSKGGVGGGGEGVRKKRRKEGGKKGEGIGERRKGTPAIVTPFCLPLASANSYCVNQKIEQACSANQTGDFS